MGSTALGILATLLGSVLFVALRRLARDRSDDAEPEGVTVFRGDAEACRSAIEVLADAGVPAWIEGGGDVREVQVDASVAPEVPALMREARSGAGGSALAREE